MVCGVNCADKAMSIIPITGIENLYQVLMFVCVFGVFIRV